MGVLSRCPLVTCSKESVFLLVLTAHRIQRRYVCHFVRSLHTELGMLVALSCCCIQLREDVFIALFSLCIQLREDPFATLFTRCIQLREDVFVGLPYHCFQLREDITFVSFSSRCKQNWERVLLFPVVAFSYEKICLYLCPLLALSKVNLRLILSISCLKPDILQFLPLNFVFFVLYSCLLKLSSGVVQTCLSIVVICLHLVRVTDPMSLEICKHLSDEVNSLSYLPIINYFGLPIPITLPVYRNVNYKESSFGIGLKGMYISPVNLE